MGKACFQCFYDFNIGSGTLAASLNRSAFVGMMLILLTTWACTHQSELPSDAEGFSQCDSGAGATEVEPKGTKKGVRSAL